MGRCGLAVSRDGQSAIPTVLRADSVGTSLDIRFSCGSSETPVAIDWSSFTPLAALCGGALIGTASGALALGLGRIAGISGIVGELFAPRSRVPGDLSWRAAFVVGLVLSPLVYGLVAPLPTVEVHASAATLVVAGLLVGLGTRYANGCTSGHGVCGLSRGSARSLVATLTFMAAAGVTVFVVRHVLS